MLHFLLVFIQYTAGSYPPKFSSHSQRRDYRSHLALEFLLPATVAFQRDPILTLGGDFGINPPCSLQARFTDWRRSGGLVHAGKHTHSPGLQCGH